MFLLGIRQYFKRTQYDFITQIFWICFHIFNWYGIWTVSQEFHIPTSSEKLTVFRRFKKNKQTEISPYWYRPGIIADVGWKYLLLFINLWSDFITWIRDFTKAILSSAKYTHSWIYGARTQGWYSWEEAHTYMVKKIKVL